MSNKTDTIAAASQGIGAACARLLSPIYNLVFMSRSDKIFDLADDIDGSMVITE